MALMQWNTLFNTNIKIIDEQHQGLVEILNSLYDSILIDNSSADLEELLEKLVNYTVIHFKTEEELLDKYNYPKTAEHKAEHNDLADKAKKYLKDYKSGDLDFTDDVIYFVKDWLKKHMVHTDKKYSAFLISKGVV